MSAPRIPGFMSRYAGTAPSKTITGRPDTSTMGLPSASSSPTATNTAVTVAASLSPVAGPVTSADRPGTTSPRSTTCDDSTRRSTGAVISDGSGGAALAAAISDVCTRDPTTQPATATPVMITRTRPTTS